MAAAPLEHADQARLALRTIVTEHGPEMLSRPGTLSNLLADLLPDSPRIARLLVAAAQDHIADELREHTSAGMDAVTASRLTATMFADATMFPLDACAWIVGEFALALGLVSDNSAPPIRFSPSATAVIAADPEKSTEPAPGPVKRGAIGKIKAPFPAGAGLGAVNVPSPTDPARPPRTKAIWTVVVTADREYFDGVIADGHVEAAAIEFPSHYPEQRFELKGSQMRIGRRSVSRKLEPEIDLAGPPTDPGISHLHAMLIAQEDGTWSVLDRGSSNGTLLNGREIESGKPIPLRDGDRVCLGAWTALTFHSART